MNIRSSIYLAVAALVAFAQPSFAEPELDAATQQLIEQLAGTALSDTDRQAAQLVIYSTILSQEAGELVEIPVEVRAKYNSVAKTIGMSIPIGGAGFGFLYFFNRSLNKLEFIYAPLTILVRWLGVQFRAALDTSGRISTAIFDNGFARRIQRLSFDSLEYTYDWIIMPIAHAISRKGSSYVAGTAVFGGSIYSSYKIVTNEVEEILDSNKARSLLGYNKALEAKLEAQVDELSQVYAIADTNKNKAKEALKDALIEQGIKNEFRDDVEYQIDVIDALQNKGLISDEVALSGRLLETVAKQALKHDVTKTDLERLKSSTAIVLALSAQIESLLLSGKLSEESEMLARQLLANSKNTITKLNAKLSL